VAVPQSDLFDAIQRFYGVTRIDHRRANDAESAEFVSLREEERKVEFAADSSIVTLANRIITDAIEIGASDIHVEPHEHLFRIRYRIDGVLHEVLQPPSEKSRPLISRLKIMADLDIAEKRRPQDGRIRVRQGERTIDIRVSTLPTDFGEKVVLRILDKSKLQLDLTKLGFEGSDLKSFERTVRLPYGMVLVTGPTGSGKTTTLYAALNSINRPEINITTIEDPIEYNLLGINQTHVRPEIGLTFAAALRSILRQDPNVIMVGEMRDTETAEIAVRAALTGHLVLTTLHTNDAPSAITRLIDMGIEPFLVGSSVKMIIAQRLLRELCPKCKMHVQPTSEQREELQLKDMGGTMFFASKGCPSCHNYGYQGRTAAYEVLPITNGLSDMIAQQVTASDLRQKAREAGMLTLRQSALKKALRGDTSLEEVIRETAA
jgi:type IV pilus assembly protein PilB